MEGRIRRPEIALIAALIGCAHAPPEVDVASVETPVRAEAGENQTPPVRRSCKGRGPRIPDGESATGVVKAAYLIGADGRVREVSVTGKASAGALKAIQRFIASCTYAPALREGKPVAVHWRGEFDFTTAPVTR